VFLDLEASVEKAVQLIESAASSGAELIAFPEAWLPGYPEWINKGARWEDAEYKALYAQLLANSVDPQGKHIDHLDAVVRKLGVMVVMGLNERPSKESRGTLHNSLITLGAGADARVPHRKLVPTHAERIVWGNGDAHGLVVHDTPVGRVGGLICWENWMPLARFTMHAQGEQIHVAVWPDVPEMNLLAARSYAFEGRCFVIAPGARLLGSDLPQDMPAADVFGPDPFSESNVILKGGSVIVGPDGEVLAKADLSDDVIYCDLDLAMADGERQAMDVAGHYNRSELFTLTVDNRRRPQVHFVEPRDDFDGRETRHEDWVISLGARPDLVLHSDQP